MSDPLDKQRGRYDRVTISTLHVALALSLLLHAVALVGWRLDVSMLPFEDPRKGRPEGSLSIRLAPPPSRPQAAVPARPAAGEKPSPVRTPSPRLQAERLPVPPRLLALEAPSPAPSPAPSTPPAADAARPPPASDFAALLEARRRARDSASAPHASQEGPPQQPTETEQERHNRVAATSLGLNRKPGLGSEPAHGGGIFQVARMGYTEAEFIFFGWNRYINRNTRQRIEVLRGNNPSIEIAVVRRMITIIREHSNDDFQWDSIRLRRNITLSARAADTPGLEEFLLREFFPEFSLR